MHKVAAAVGFMLLTTALTLPAAASATPTSSANAGYQVATSALSGFSHLIVDAADARVFVTEGLSGKLGVFDTFDHPVATISGLSDPTGLALSLDSSTVYVAESQADAVIAVDTQTLKVTATYELAAESCPVGLTMAADLLWVGESSEGCDSGNGTGSLGAIDLATGQVYDAVSAGVFGQDSGPVLTSSPALPNVVIARYDYNLVKYDVTGTTGGTAPTATLAASMSTEVDSMAMTPDGSGLLIACGAPYHHILLSTADLTLIRTYRSTYYPNAAAIRGDGLVAAGVNRGHPTIWLYIPGETARYSWYDFDPRPFLASDGLAFGTSHLFAVTVDDYGDNPTLHMFVPKRRPTISISTDHTQYAYGAKAKITARLGHYGDADPVVSIYATPYKGTKKLVARGRVHADGTFVASVPVSVRTTLTAAFTGDAHTMSVQAGKTVLVHARVYDLLHGYYAKSGTARLYHVTQNPVESVTVSPSKPTVCVYFHFQWYVNGAWGYDQRTTCVHLNQQSQAGVRLVGTHEVGERVRVRAEFRGGPANLAANGLYRYIKFTK